MYLFACDETNKNPTPGQFFIYGGIVLTDWQIEPVHRAVADIRLKYGYRPGDAFKFNIRQRPEHVDADDAKRAKRAVMKTLDSLGVRMIVYVMLHDIGMNQTDETRMRYALNVVTLRYHDLLRRESASGEMVIDRDDKLHGFLANTFQHGVVAPEWVHPVSDRILQFGMNSNNASHVSSAADIALGAFRYCVNTAGGRGRSPIAHTMYPPIAHMIWGVRVGDKFILDHHGYNQYPLHVQRRDYAQRYQDLLAALAQYSGADVGVVRAA